MTKKDRQREQILQHGFKLIRVFNLNGMTPPISLWKAVLNAWRYMQEENPGEDYRWIESYTRKDGVQVRGYWRKRPVRATLRKAA